MGSYYYCAGCFFTNIARLFNEMHNKKIISPAKNAGWDAPLRAPYFGVILPRGSIMFYDEDFLESILPEPVEGVVKACDKAISSFSDW